ncbi:DUF2178 domain-containing protein [Halocatena salina]|uniref:DUF2178 domain-containing protein n=1 Tax=Halocatena salina TaxID=2934340 RepID=A0A8U0A2G4_9EURY|nr:DUF2178 domain-containing protein [Halocatena salina]UPM42989.1 DUF2178 domain-containing protein [Halocatena salina]
MNACISGGIVAYLAGVLSGYVTLGTIIYWAGFLGMVGIWRGTSIELYDEREQQIDREAAGLTLWVFSFVLVLGGPALFALETVGSYDMPPELWGAFYAYCVVYLVFGAIYTVHRKRS